MKQEERMESKPGSRPVPDETYMDALRHALKTFITAPTLLGQVDQRTEEACNAHDVEKALYWEQLLPRYADDQRELVYFLLLLALVTSRLEEVVGRALRSCWVAPLAGVPRVVQ